MCERHGESDEAEAPALRQGEAFDPFEAGERDPQALPGAEDAELMARARTELGAAGKPADAAGRTEALLARMRADRRALLAMLRACEKPCDAEALARAAQGAQAGVSVYSPETLRRLLEQAGAVECVDRDGNPYSAAEAAPRTVVVDGVECLEPGEPPVPYWVATEAGHMAAEADKPLSRLEALFEEKADYLPIFKRVLAMCAQGQPVRTKEINAAVDADPLVQSPRYFASYFTERLEECDALVWEGGWKTTDEGLEGLAMLADVVDEADLS